jgi:hypothetical protein
MPLKPLNNKVRPEAKQAAFDGKQLPPDFRGRFNIGLDPKKFLFIPKKLSTAV